MVQSIASRCQGAPAPSPAPFSEVHAGVTARYLLQVVDVAGPTRILSGVLRRPTSLVGIDIGSSAVKAVELTRSGAREVVAAAGVQPLPADSIVKGTIADRAAVAGAIRTLLSAAAIRGRDVALSVPGGAVVAREITMPRMSPAELAGSIVWEAERHIPFDLCDVNLDYQVVVDREGDVDPQAPMVVLLVAAKKTTIAEYVAAVTAAGCAPAVVDVAAFALQNAYAMQGGFERGGLVALLNAGASTVNVNIVRGGRSVFSRDIALGGNACTDALRRMYALSFEEAERLKKGSPIRGERREDVEPVLQEVTEDLLLEVEKTFDFFAASQPPGRIDRIVLSGGASQGAEFAAAMVRRFDAPVEWFEPFRGATGLDLEAGWRDPADRAATAGVAAGLALRRTGDG